MKYILMMNTMKAGHGVPEWPQQDLQAHIAFMMDLNKELHKRGELVSAEGLSFPDYLYEHAFLTPAIEFAIESLFPGTKVPPASAYRNHYFAPHYLPFNMGVGIVLTSQVVAVICSRFVRRQSLEEFLIVLKQAALVIVDEYRRSNVHRIDQGESLLDPALA